MDTIQKNEHWLLTNGSLVMTRSTDDGEHWCTNQIDAFGVMTKDVIINKTQFAKKLSLQEARSFADSFRKENKKR